MKEKVHYLATLLQHRDRHLAPGATVLAPSQMAAAFKDAELAFMAEDRMRTAMAVAALAVADGTWSRDKYNRYARSCFKASLMHRVGGELWAKIFLALGKVDKQVVTIANEYFEDL